MRKSDPCCDSKESGPQHVGMEVPAEAITSSISLQTFDELMAAEQSSLCKRLGVCPMVGSELK